MSVLTPNNFFPLRDDTAKRPLVFLFLSSKSHMFTVKLDIFLRPMILNSDLPFIQRNLLSSLVYLELMLGKVWGV